MSFEAMSYEVQSREIAEALIAIEGVGFRPGAPITFKSGIKSPVYCDNRRFPFWPEQWAKVICGFEGLIAERGIAVDVVGGVEAAGIPHSAALGFAMKLPSVFIRKELKEHGTKKRVEGGDVTGRRVVLVEDLVTTGGSSIAAIEALRAEGAVVSDCLAIINYDFPEAVELFARSGVRLHATTTFPVVLECALKQGMIDEAGAEVVRDWLMEPRSWAKRHGFE
ncbi:MAG: orotate phosphoribosyltransferase [Acidobacteriaceae bacterium]